MEIFLTNSLTRKKEKFVPWDEKGKRVGMYTCGPTVYDYITIGNFRTYTVSDILYRTLLLAGYDVNYIINITDVGHLTGDNLGDADSGEDKIEKSARKEGKNAWEIAKFYTDAFLKDFRKLNLSFPAKFTKATDHIKEQIELVKRIEKRGFTYRTSDGIYFDVQAFEKKTGKKYGELSTLDQIKEGARVARNPQKKDPRDFALWKFSPTGVKRQMEWDSPWGIGFPGWHIECSAMSMKYLGESFEIHVGGEDLRQIHHPNEIAQSEAATGKPFVKYWIHVAFLMVEGKKMSKSLGNFYTLADLEKKGFDPLSLRYLYLTSHYRDPLNFTWEGLRSAAKALERIREYVMNFLHDTRTALSSEKEEKIVSYRSRFEQALFDDINTPAVLAILWEVLKSNMPAMDKIELLIFFDEVLGLNLVKVKRRAEENVPAIVLKLVRERERLRKKGQYAQADEKREEIKKLGFEVVDQPRGPVIKRKKKF